MRTAGVDLAAEAKGTALAVIEWRADAAQLVELHLGVADPAIVEAAREVDKLGIDCALGWPDAFVQFVTAHASGSPDTPAVDGGMEWRRTLAYRETDRRAREITAGGHSASRPTVSGSRRCAARGCSPASPSPARPSIDPAQGSWPRCIPGPR